MSYGQGDAFGVVESVKAASDVYAPVSGEVVETNPALEDEPELVNSDPYGDGWLLRLQLADSDELEGLLSAEAYEALQDE
jgi:glycine cleavage system H protein